MAERDERESAFRADADRQLAELAATRDKREAELTAAHDVDAERRLAERAAACNLRAAACNLREADVRAALERQLAELTAARDLREAAVLADVDALRRQRVAAGASWLRVRGPGPPAAAVVEYEP